MNEILIKNSTYSNSCLKKRLVEEDYLKYECEWCNLTNKWNDKNLTLQIDHINGDSSDNRIENLRFLCPNCHTQTPTHSVSSRIKKIYKCMCGIEISKSSKFCKKCRPTIIRKSKDRYPSLPILLLQIENYGYVKTGKIYNVSDNAIRKWLKNHYNVSPPKKSKPQNLLKGKENQVLDMISKGMTHEAIGLEFDCTRHQVAYIVDKFKAS
jgi:hypothetical protein